MKYTVIRTNRPNDYHEAVDLLEEEVSKEIRNGWQPLGGICISSYKIGSTIYHNCFQAMIKEDD